LDEARGPLKEAYPAWQAIATESEMAHETMIKFGYPNSLICEYEHWTVLLRAAQVTLGSLVLVAKSDATAFGRLPSGAHAELAAVTRDIEATLFSEVAYDKINYLMLMMVDPHVHFHVIPRYEGFRSFGPVTIVDAGWPGPPDLKSAPIIAAEHLDGFRTQIYNRWLTIC
jgi:diadenosine tetraphosphate (Ap4A) HIT family hydrolase